MTSKIIGYGQTLWNHKKKAVFFGGLGVWGLSYLNQLNREQTLRTSYARKAGYVGRTLLKNLPNGENYVPPKLHVFVDRSDPLYNKNLASFNTNVLPLLDLAGFDVLIKNAASEQELRSLSQSADIRNCAGVIVVGSEKYSVPPVLDGLFVGTEARTALAVFDPADRDDVEGLFKKAMRIINDHRRVQHVYSVKVYPSNSEEGPSNYSSSLKIADIQFGWFDFCGEKQPKFWWFGALSERIAFTWYFLKSYPQPMSIHGKITLHCTGCRRCITEAAQDPGKASQRWWENWIGKREQPGDQKRRKYANVLNDECGKQMELKLNPADVIIQNLNNGERGGLHLQTIDSSSSRWKIIWRVWKEFKHKKGPSNFFVDQARAQIIELNFDENIPERISETKSVKNLNDVGIKKIVAEALLNTIQMY